MFHKFGWIGASAFQFDRRTSAIVRKWRLVSAGRGLSSWNESQWVPGKVGAREIVVPTPTGEVCLSPPWQMRVFSRCPSVRVDGVQGVHWPT